MCGKRLQPLAISIQYSVCYIFSHYLKVVSGTITPSSLRVQVGPLLLLLDDLYLLQNRVITEFWRPHLIRQSISNVMLLILMDFPNLLLVLHLLVLISYRLTNKYQFSIFHQKSWMVVLPNIQMEKQLLRLGPNCLR